jgi:hypothetical protein
MNDTKFQQEPPQGGSRVSIHYGKPPRPYVVQGWKNGHLVVEQVCQTKDEAEQYQLALAKSLR